MVSPPDADVFQPQRASSGGGSGGVPYDRELLCGALRAQNGMAVVEELWRPDASRIAVYQKSPDVRNSRRADVTPGTGSLLSLSASQLLKRRLLIFAGVRARARGEGEYELNTAGLSRT